MKKLIAIMLLNLLLTGCATWKPRDTCYHRDENGRVDHVWTVSSGDGCSIK